jgi:hypothetical protein
MLFSGNGRHRRRVNGKAARRARFDLRTPGTSSPLPRDRLGDFYRGRCRQSQVAASSRLPALSKVVRQSCYELLRRDFKSLADAQQREHRHGTACLNHLPVTDTKPVGNHILLAELALRSMRPDAVAQGTKEPRKISREFSAGAHTLGCDRDEQKHHEQNFVLAP